MAVVDILRSDRQIGDGLAWAPGTYAADLAQKIVAEVRAQDNASYQESHSEWDACRQQTQEEKAGLFDAWRRRYLAAVVQL